MVSDFLIGQIETNKDKIGKLLLEHTTLTQEQLDEALQTQEQTGMMIGEILVKKNYIHHHDIIKVLALQMHIPYTDNISIDEFDPALIKDLPINYSRQQEILPILETPHSVTVAMADPFRFDTVNDLRALFKKEIKILVTSPLRVQEAINRVYERATKNVVNTIENEFEESLDLDGPIDILDAAADEAPVIRFVNSIIFRAVKEKASDIHIEPYEREVSYRFRINGVMTEVLKQPLKTHSAVSARIKVMARLDIAEKRLPQDGRIKVKIAGKDIDLRLSTVPVQHGERIVMRILEKSNAILSLEQLGFHTKVLSELEELTHKKHGIIYVTGPTGHGKTTTLFALLQKMNAPERMIITVEDPVEYELPGISQIQVNHKIELSFAIALRSILRQNPDVIMVGETRDFETADMAIQASLTGHFVLSTLHTNDASSAPTRLMDMGVEPFLIASSLIGVMAQRLIRVLCQNCKAKTEATDYELALMGLTRVPAHAVLYKAHGCPKCSYTGYSGRTCVSEFLTLNDEIRALILERADAARIKKAAIKSGMLALREDALEKVLKGITSIEEMTRAINAEEKKEE